MTDFYRWLMHAPGQPMVKEEGTVPEPAAGEVRVKIAGCGVCHTDIGFHTEGGVRTNHELPLALGHEISGTVEACGEGSEEWAGKPVVVPAVLPCGDCELCQAGCETSCRQQKMPGNDFHGGFSTHIILSSRWLVDASGLPEDLDLADVSVLADAISTPYQACVRAEVSDGDCMVIIGAGGVGSFGIQIARAMGARVIAVDIDDSKLERSLEYGAIATVNTHGMDTKESRKAVQMACKAQSFPRVKLKVLEMSGTVPGQELAWSLMSFSGVVGIVGFTLKRVEVRLSNLMAFDARAFGNWGCRPQLYTPALDMIRNGEIQVLPFIKHYPMDEINEVLDGVRSHKIGNRPVLIP
ncbi:MAG TPA: 6-hydroxycyclohex-1-ene-1-carbonyl-CoA dehydrogenase [Planctomycetota bacterium]|nr:6-hydroxycyclohex-1-ene-1-carbonyl-CoA dehydrogenase [Planctomycetota bacterium]MDP7245699.1 6-hydroxycyclohex-1-ene-1-carbonyl-CoA dehydrogenase [Planctomycetota bacterium]MDP7559124.1 6-hydroxycyclohex-1-ene-1-carbonyl-CoA dehydrogenase [Planctomycetota bacterium]HJM38675.1 6-hydroxycyclohex-1-ene-1-carbonyl-CoA dehydrogenase [Planctomycetota bacterium]